MAVGWQRVIKVGGNKFLFQCDEVTESWIEKEVQLQKRVGNNPT
jgi:hypothetical protein